MTPLIKTGARAPYVAPAKVATAIKESNLIPHLERFAAAKEAVADAARPHYADMTEPKPAKREPFKPGIYDDISNADYHRDQSLSSTGARLIVQDGGPELFKYRQSHPEKKDAYDVGTVFHSITLEGDESGVVIVEGYDNWRTKDAQNAKREAEDAGKIAFLPHEFRSIQAMRDSVMAHPRARRLLEFGEAEQSMFAEFEGVKVRARPDKWTAEHPDYGPIIVDLKSCRDASYDGFQKDTGGFGYFQQDPWYKDVLESQTGLKARSFYICCEKTAPYRVNVHEHDSLAIDGGRLVNAHAMNIYQQCMESGIWPGFKQSAPVELKPWDEAKLQMILEG